MIRFIALAPVAAATPAPAGPLTVRVGETWLFTLDHGEPIHARKAVTRRTCALPAGNQPALEIRPRKAASVAILEAGGRC